LHVQVALLQPAAPSHCSTAGSKTPLPHVLATHWYSASTQWQTGDFRHVSWVNLSQVTQLGKG
jgi:hypothetical protein